MSKKTQVDLLVAATWIVPVVPRDRVLQDCCIVVDKGKVLAIGIENALRNQYEPKESLTLKGHALLPGLINAHGHSPMSLMRGFADDKPLMQWLEEHIWPAEQKWVSERFVRDGSMLAIAEMLSSGTTCFSDMYFFPEETAKVAHESGIRAQLYCPILDFPTVWGSGPEEYLRKTIALHDQFRAHDLISVGFGPHAPYTVSDEPLNKIATYAEELQALVQIHLHETADEVASSLQSFGKSPSQRLFDLGLLSPLTQCVHMTQIVKQDLEILANSGAHVVHCPESNAKLASGICPVDELLGHGINVCLGTDGAASNNDLDMFGEMKNAALIGKIKADDASALDAMTTLELATINGARALGMEDKIGSLEPGKYADMIAVDLSGLEHQPVYNPISQLVYTQAGHKVPFVWVNGKPLVKNYGFTTLNPETIVNAAQDWGGKLGKH